MRSRGTREHIVISFRRREKLRFFWRLQIYRPSRFFEALGLVFVYVDSSLLGLLRMHFLHTTQFSIITLHILLNALLNLWLLLVLTHAYIDGRLAFLWRVVKYPASYSPFQSCAGDLSSNLFSNSFFNHIIGTDSSYEWNFGAASVGGSGTLKNFVSDKLKRVKFPPWRDNEADVSMR